MKKTLTLAILIAGTLTALTSCSEKAKLAQSITGSWSGQSERVETPNQPTTTTVTRIYTFVTDENSSTGGTFEATADFSVESGTKLLPAGTQPIAVTVNGNATISGRWEAIDDDEIMISYDSNTLKVTVDPQEVVLEYNIASQTSEPIQENIKPEIAKAVERLITAEMRHNVFTGTKFDDIKIKGTLMSCEINKKDYTFHRDL